MSECDLHLLITSEEVSYCIILGKQVVALRSYLSSGSEFLSQSSHVEGILNRDDMLSRRYKSVRIAIEDPSHKLVPDEFFEAEELATLYHYGSSNFNKELYFDQVETLNHYNIFSVDRSLRNLLELQFRSPKFVSAFSCLLSTLLKENNRNIENRLLINVHNNRLQIFAMKQDKLDSHSGYEFKTGEDFLYYLLHSVEKAKLKPSNTIAIISGNLERKSSHYQLASSYLPKIYFGSRPDTYDYREELGIFPYHFHYQLYSI